MSRILRMASGMPVAATITFFLFLGMMMLIRVEHLPEPVLPDVEIDIFPQVPEIDFDPPGYELDSVEPVEPPPPPVRLDSSPAAVDAAPVAVSIASLPNIGGLELGATTFTMPDNRDETPVVRIEPTYPPRLLNQGVEGDCVVTYGIAADGTPFDVAANCTNSGFVRAAERAVERWRFNPRRVDGVNVARSGRQTTLNFRIEG
ncbi:MAG: hypothetical protein CMF74_08520 [Maricaulis sp.]|nr:hypothetical protein [Maricaulis sp.]